jgi:prepilin-type N-terminal cleavage/methylation domain-containing protein
MMARQPRRGVSLLEMLIAMAVIGVALNLGAILVLAAMRTDQMSAETMRRIARQTQLADLFRDDVAKSIAAPDEWGEYKRSPTCLILRQPGDRWVVYRVDGSMIQQITRTPEGEARRPIEVGPSEADIEFDRGDGVIILRVTERHKHLPGQQREIRAALGGDLK